MRFYKVIFGEHLGKDFTNIQHFSYCANDKNKTIKDIKDFLCCYDNRLCICMLKYFIESSSIFSSSFLDYIGSDENQIQLNKLNTDKISIMKIKKECSCGSLSKNLEFIKLSKNELIEKLKESMKEIEKLQKTDELKTTQTKIIDFYDVIIDINSILNLKEGWKIKMTPEGEKKYEEFKDQELIVIGVVGNRNNGKTFILSKLSKIFLPSSTSINTEGISVKYPDLKNNENRKYILLDSAGLETPILKNKDENEIEGDTIEINNKFKQKARDIMITESFLQNFIISNSNILLLVVDILSYSEQKLIKYILLF